MAKLSMIGMKSSMSIIITSGRMKLTENRTQNR